MKKINKFLAFIAFLVAYFAGASVIVHLCGNYVVDGMFYLTVWTFAFPFISGMAVGKVEDIIHDRQG